jgi:hypothetical protein
MTTLNLDTVNLPKYCELARIRKDAHKFIEYYRKAKGRDPEKLSIHQKYQPLFAKAIKADDNLKRDYGLYPDYQLFDLPVEFV